MSIQTEQTKFWESEFGKEYTDRNTFSPEAWNKWYLENFGITKDDLNNKFLAGIEKNARILEVGCNIGQQLIALQRIGFTNLYGIELQAYAVEKAKENTKNINIIQGSGFDLPFRDNYFDLVFTNGVLIHIHPNDLEKIMKEMVRVSRQYIWGFEYYSEQPRQIKYRGHDGYMWKMDYAEKFRSVQPHLHVVKKEVLPYLTEQHKGNADCMYLLSK
jgi:pseudaminic acid biosynthesis-associated methylase